MEKLVIVPKALRFELDGRSYLPGDDRTYEVFHRGHFIGYVERAWLPSPHVGGEPVHGWGFVSTTRKHFGEGATRKAAVVAAYAEEGK